MHFVMSLYRAIQGPAGFELGCILELMRGLHLDENQDKSDVFLYAPHQCPSLDCCH